MGWLDRYLTPDIAEDGTVISPQRNAINFIGATVVDNVNTKQTDITINGNTTSLAYFTSINDFGLSSPQTDGYVLTMSNIVCVGAQLRIFANINYEFSEPDINIRWTIKLDNTEVGYLTKPTLSYNNISIDKVVNVTAGTHTIYLCTSFDAGSLAFDPSTDEASLYVREESITVIWQG